MSIFSKFVDTAFGYNSEMTNALGASVVMLWTIPLAYWYINRETKKEVNQIADYKELEQFMGEDGFILSKNVRLAAKYSKQHVGIFGPTSAGKTSRIIKHNVKLCDSCSIICTDPSRDIERDVFKKGFRVYCLDPDNVNNSVGFNPLYYCKDEFAVREIMQTILINGYMSSEHGDSDASKWVRIVLPFVSTYAIYNYKYKKYDFAEMINNILSKPIHMTQIVKRIKEVQVGQDRDGLPITKKVEVQERVINKNSIEYEIRETEDKALIDEFEAFLNSARNPELMSNMYTVLNAAFVIFRDPKIKKLCSRPILNIKSLRGKKSILYIQIPEYYAEQYKPITSVYLTQLFNTLQDNTEGLDVFFLLDELCNVGLIPNFHKLLATIRRYNMGVLACTQSISQLALIYGDAQMRVILENFNTLCAMSGLSESSGYFSRMLGTMVEESDKGERIKEVLSADEVRRLDEDEMLIIAKNKRGVVDKLLPYYPIVN